jgi:polysaccharide biosynthesis protein PslF
VTAQLSSVRIRCAMISTLPPTQCGLATFAQALSGGFASLGAAVDLVRVLQEPRHRLPGPIEPAPETRSTSSNDGPPGVLSTVAEPVTVSWADDRAALRASAEALNRYDVVILQHEYGIYGGPDGERVLSLLEQVKAPVVTVLHTVLSRPTPRQHRVLRDVVAASAVVVTMTHLARARAVQVYGADPQRAVVIPHGAAEDLVVGSEAPRPTPAGATAPVVLTWGLLGRGKGIEWAIRALSTLSGLRPHPHYVVAGRSHPRLSAADGIGYRHELVSLAEDLGVSSHVTFDDRYLDTEALHALVRSADVVLLPYDSLEQVTSGVLTEAVAAGKPVIATRFPHAVELLGDGTGLLVDQGDAAAIADALCRVLTEPELAERLSQRAEQLAAGLSWRAVAQEYLRVCAGVHRRDVDLELDLALDLDLDLAVADELGLDHGRVALR